MTTTSSSTTLHDVRTNVELLDQDDQEAAAIESDHRLESDDKSQTINKVVRLDQYRTQREGKGAGSTEENESFTATLHSTASQKPLTDIPISGGGVFRKPSIEFTAVVRAQLTRPILDALEKIQPHALSPDALVYINDILHTIKQMERAIPRDPFLEVLFAFYDAVSFENQWKDFDATGFAEVRDVLKKCAKRPELRQSDIEKAIMRLEKIGLDTTPIPVVLDED